MEKKKNRFLQNFQMHGVEIEKAVSDDESTS